MRRANIVSGIVLAAFGLLMLLFIIPAQIEEVSDEFISPRLMPNMMMLLVTGLALVLIWSNLRDGKLAKNESIPFRRSETVVLLKIAGVFGTALLCFVWLSPLVAGVVLISGSSLALGERNFLIVVLMPIVLLLLIWLLFYRVLGTPIV